MAQDTPDVLAATKAVASKAEDFDKSVKGESKTGDAATVARGVASVLGATPYAVAHDVRVKSGAAPDITDVAKGLTWKKEQKSSAPKSDVCDVASGIRWKPQQ